MQIRVAAAAAVLLAVQAQVPDDAPADLGSPEDLAPGDKGEVFGPACEAPTDCWSLEDPFPTGDAGIQCVNGACVCSGDYHDPNAFLGEDAAGWVCTPVGVTSPFIEMLYSLEFNGVEASREACEARDASFDAFVAQEIISFYQLTEYEQPPALCGSIHYAGKGKTNNPGKTGFADAFGNNNNNPYGAPVIRAQKAALVVNTCTPTSPVLTMALIAGLCQPLTCESGYTLVSSGTITVASQCVVTPPPGVIATLAPATGAPGGGVQVITRDGDGEDLSYGAIFGIAFGIAVLVAIIAGVAGYMYKQKQDAIELEAQEQRNLNQQEQQNNGPDKEADEDPMV